MKKPIVKLVAMLLAMIALCAMLLLPAAAEVNIEAGLNSAWNTVFKTIMNIIIGIGVGGGCLFAVVMIFYNSILLSAKRRNGEGYSSNITNIVIAVISLALVASFPAWGPLILGVGA